MTAYIVPIKTAFMVFPLLAVIFTIPYIMYEYHKYGSILALRVIMIYSFILYMLSAYFLAILPLPPISEVAVQLPKQPRLELFAELRDLLRTSGFILGDRSTYVTFLANEWLFQIAANVAMLVPFGVYMRYYFQKKWYQVVVLAFGLSFFYELTQLSGLYGIYPHAYRTFEVDDLMHNVFGGMMGFVVAHMFAFFLPSKDKLDHISYERGKDVSLMR